MKLQSRDKAHTMASAPNHVRIILYILAVAVVANNHASSALSAGRLRKTNINCGRAFATTMSLQALGRPCDGEHANTPLDATITAGSYRRRVAISLATSFLAIPILALTTPYVVNAATRDPKTGILLPSVGEIQSSIPTSWDESDNPLVGGDSSSLSRLDSSPDSIFYSEPRFVEHVDEQAVESMTSYISDGLLRPGDSMLDLCSSWTSHIRPGRASELKRVAGLGMNAKELESNGALTEWTVQDLNADKNVKLPYDDGSFDVILLQLSIDYLIHPLEVMGEASRVLKKDGKIAVLFSNRLFLSKAVGLWTGSDDLDKAYTVGSYLHFCDGGFINIKAEDLSTRKRKGKEQVIVGDPLYVVTATKG